MTAARHARPPAATRPATATAVALTVLLAVALLQWLPANVAPATPWHYPCVMHVAGWFEWFTPSRLFWNGWCNQP